MTHEELIEKVANTLIMTLEPSLTCDDFIKASAAAISTILTALQEPTEEMIEVGMDAIDSSWERGANRPAANSPITCWQAMLNACPLAGEKRGAE